jgi:ADP-ribosylglycohydrolase
LLSSSKGGILGALALGRQKMIGAIAGDIIGSVYEAHPIKTKDFSLFHPGCRFTDDTVLTVAVAQAILEHGDYLYWLQEMGCRYPNAGYGGSFIHWLRARDPQPYGSWGNGSAMRVSPVGFAFDTVDDVLREAARSAAVSHDHPEGIKGAQALALAVYLVRTSGDKELVRREVSDRFEYDLTRTVDEIRPSYRFDVSCQGSVPEAIVAFLDSDSYEDAIRNAVSLGGDSDTLACMAGGIAEAFYGPVPGHIQQRVRTMLPGDLSEITDRFEGLYGGRDADDASQ